jgi:hypothetical protein
MAVEEWGVKRPNSSRPDAKKVFNVMSVCVHVITNAISLRMDTMYGVEYNRDNDVIMMALVQEHD